MSVRKRPHKSDPTKFSWVVDYRDGQGTRRLKTLPTKKAADNFAATANVEVREGTHVADGASCTVAEAGRLWVEARTRAGRERSTIDQYRTHLNHHLKPFIGETKLNTLSVPAVRAFEEKLLDAGRSPALVKKVLVSLGSLLADSQERGLVARNVVRDMRVRRGSSDSRAVARAKGKLKVGVDIPSPIEIKAIVGALQGRWRPILLTMIFTGIRASEARGLTWSTVDLDRKKIKVHQRADRYAEIGRPKSASGERIISIPPLVVNTLKEWRLACPRGDHNLVFPNTTGGVLNHQQIMREGFGKAQVRAGVTNTGNDVLPRYSGLHAIRHFHASWLINRPQEGGLGLSPKQVQERLGHSSIALTLNTYSHLFPQADDGDELAAAALMLVGTEGSA